MQASCFVTESGLIIVSLTAATPRVTYHPVHSTAGKPRRPTMERRRTIVCLGQAAVVPNGHMLFLDSSGTGAPGEKK